MYIEAPIVLAMSYLCFWLGELICGTSAVIAVVCMGLYVNNKKEKITADVFHFLHEFYEMVRLRSALTANAFAANPRARLCDTSVAAASIASHE